MIELLHPNAAAGTIPINTILADVALIDHEIGVAANTTSSVIGKAIASFMAYDQIASLVADMGHIKGQTSETITTHADGSKTWSEVGNGWAISLSEGFVFATAAAHAYSSGAHLATAVAETAAAVIGFASDSIAVAYGDLVDATTTVG